MSANPESRSDFPNAVPQSLPSDDDHGGPYFFTHSPPRAPYQRHPFDGDGSCLAEFVLGRVVLVNRSNKTVGPVYTIDWVDGLRETDINNRSPHRSDDVRRCSRPLDAVVEITPRSTPG